MGGKVYALPSDYGPSAMFYNSATLKKAGVDEPPATWDEYYEAAKKIRALGGDYYIAQDTGDPFFLLSLIWQAGGRPFKVDGTKVRIDFSDEGTSGRSPSGRRCSTRAWSTPRSAAGPTTGTGRSTTARSPARPWAAGSTSTLPERAPNAAGDFRVALMPQWQEGEKIGSENGGSALRHPGRGREQGGRLQVPRVLHARRGRARPASRRARSCRTRSVLQSEEFRGKANEYFGGQKTGAVLAEASEIVGSGWQYTPFFEWAAHDLRATSRRPYYTSGKGSLAEILEQWRQRCIQYGNEQGFEVS